MGRRIDVDPHTIYDWTGHSRTHDDRGRSAMESSRGLISDKCVRTGTFGAGDGGFGRARRLIKAVCMVTVVASLVAFLGTSTQARRNSGSSFRFGFEKVAVPLDGSVRLVGSQTSSLIKHAADVSAPLLQVFQVYPPVLTISPGGTLELTDGGDTTTTTTTTASVALANTNTASCSETLVVHSFAYSYGQPYIGVFFPFVNETSSWRALAANQLQPITSRHPAPSTV